MTPHFHYKYFSSKSLKWLSSLELFEHLYEINSMWNFESENRFENISNVLKDRKISLEIRK